MFGRFTASARRVVSVAHGEARVLGHPSIAPEHLLLGALRSRGAANAALQRFDLDEGDVRTRVRTRLRRVDRQAEVVGQLPFTPEAKSALEAAIDLADNMRDPVVGTKHLLLALSESDPSANLLHELGIQAGDVRVALSELPSNGGDDDVSVVPDPRDPGLAITARLGEHLVGDLGNARTDAHLLLAIVLRNGPVAAWLREHGVDEASVDDAFGPPGF